MEYWKPKTDEGLNLVSDPGHHHKIRFRSAKPIVPTLQYSIIPLCRVTAEPVFSDPRKEHGINDWLSFQPVGPTARRENQVFFNGINKLTK